MHETTDKAIFLWIPGTSFGNIARVPGAGLKHPKGIRDIEEWYVSLVTRPDRIYEIFRWQCEIALEDLLRIFAAAGNRPTIAMITGTDFGAQNGPFISPRIFRRLFCHIISTSLHGFTPTTNGKSSAIHAAR